MEKKQSSIDWLINQLQKSKDFHRVLNEVSQMSTAKIDIIEQAKAMHKQEIKEAWLDGEWWDSEKDGEQYYNETFGDEKEML